MHLYKNKERISDHFNVFKSIRHVDDASDGSVTNLPVSLNKKF